MGHAISKLVNFMRDLPIMVTRFITIFQARAYTADLVESTNHYFNILFTTALSLHVIISCNITFHLSNGVVDCARLFLCKSCIWKIYILVYFVIQPLVKIICFRNYFYWILSLWISSDLWNNTIEYVMIAEVKSMYFLQNIIASMYEEFIHENVVLYCCNSYFV